MKKNILLTLIACIAQLKASDSGRPEYTFVPFNSAMSYSLVEELTGNMSHVHHGIYHELCDENVPYYIVYKNISDQHAEAFRAYYDVPPRIPGKRYQYGHVYDHDGHLKGKSLNPEQAKQYCKEGHLKEEISAIKSHSLSWYDEKTETIRGKRETIKATNVHRTWYSRFMNAGLLGIIGFGGYSAYSPSKPAFIAAGVSAAISISSAYGESHCRSKSEALRSEILSLQKTQGYYATPRIAVIAKSRLPDPNDVEYQSSDSDSDGDDGDYVIANHGQEAHHDDSDREEA